MELSVRDYKRAIADGKLDDWSPKDIERWLDVYKRQSLDAAAWDIPSIAATSFTL